MEQAPARRMSSMVAGAPAMEQAPAPARAVQDERDLLPRYRSRLAADNYRHLWTLADALAQPPPHVSPNRILATTRHGDDIGPHLSATSRIRLRQGANFALPEPPNRLTAAAAFVPPPENRPALRRSPREHDDGLYSRGLRAWQPGAIRWDAHAGHYVVGGSTAGVDSRCDHAGAAAPAAALPTTALMPRAPESVPPVSELPESSMDAKTWMETSAARAAQSRLPIGSLVPLPTLMLTSLPASPRHAAHASESLSARVKASPRDVPPSMAMRTTPVGGVRVYRPRASPRRAQLLESLTHTDRDRLDAPSPLPPLPAPGSPLSALDEEVLAVALRKPAHVLELAATRHTGLSRVGRRWPRPDGSSVLAESGTL